MWRIVAVAALYAASSFLGDAEAGQGYWSRDSGQLSASDTLAASCDALQTPSLSVYRACVQELIDAAPRHCPPDPVIGGTPSHQGGGFYRANLSAIGGRLDNFGTCISSFAWSSLVAGLNTPVSCPGGLAWDPETGNCPEPDPCEELEGMQYAATFPVSELGALQEDVCMSIAGGVLMCSARRVLTGCVGDTCRGVATVAGQSCGTPEVEDAVPAPEVNCVSHGGVTQCFRSSSPNCGTVNGEEVCLSSIPENGCSSTRSGAVVCGAAATAPPAPTDATGMAPADPDAELVGGPGDETVAYRYYSPATVAQSGTPVVSGGSGEGGGHGDDGDGECDEPGECEGTIPTLAEVETFGALTSAFLDRVRAAPIVDAAVSLGASMPEGVCPAPSVNLPYLDDVTLELDAHCEMWPEIAPVIQGVMLACWVFVGVRIFLSA